LIYNGGVAVGANPISYQAAGVGGVFTSLANANSIVVTGSGNCPTGSIAARYVWALITLDDTQVGSFPDVNGTSSSITDFTVNYSTGHATPNLRLRGGSFFSSNSLQALDTCGS
jgi:hypothetical protein